jgi:hypothetical protein
MSPNSIEATASAGSGYFRDSAGNVTTGNFVSGGAFVGSPLAYVSAVNTNQSPWALGAFAGVGRGLFITNANSVCNLKGPFNQYNLDLGPVGFSFSIGSDGTWVFSITAGPGGIASASGYPTTTEVSVPAPVVTQRP